MIIIICLTVFLLLQKKQDFLLSNLRKEKEYFEEVDAFELLEETPSPRKCTTWVMGAEQHAVPQHNLTAILARWGLSGITETSLEKPVEKSLLPFFNKLSIEEREGEGEGEGENEIAGSESVEPHMVQHGLPIGEDQCLSAFTQLLMVCKQTAPVSLREVLSAYWYTFLLFEWIIFWSFLYCISLCYCFNLVQICNLIVVINLYLPLLFGAVPCV